MDISVDIRTGAGLDTTTVRLLVKQAQDGEWHVESADPEATRGPLYAGGHTLEQALDAAHEAVRFALETTALVFEHYVHESRGERPTIANQTLKFADLARDNAIRDTRFVGCTLLGPAIVTPMGHSSLENCTFRGNLDDIDGNFYVFERPRIAVGVIGLIDVEFEDCIFDGGVGWAGPPQLISQLKAALFGPGPKPQ